MISAPFSFFPEYGLDKSVIQSYDETNKKVSKESEVDTYEQDFRFDPGLPKKPNKRSSIFTRMTKVLLVKK